MSRRDRIDPETARRVEQRLQWLLSENGPEGRPRPEPEPATASRGTTAPPPRRSRTGPQHPPIPDRVPRPSLAEPIGLPGVIAAFRRPHLVVVATVVALGLLVAGWAVLRARPVAVAVTPPITSGSSTAAPAGGPAAGAPSPSASTSVVVHVLGAVREPGLVSLAAGSRVQDALDAAGGLTRKADPGELNLAQPVSDGQQIVVGTQGKPSGEVRDGSGGPTGAGSGSAGSSGGASGAGQPVNLNTAGEAQLEELPGVGPVMAGKIIAWRTEHGRFSRVEELQEIDGVGPKTYAKLAPLCRV